MKVSLYMVYQVSGLRKASVPREKHFKMMNTLRGGGGPRFSSRF